MLGSDRSIWNKEKKQFMTHETFRQYTPLYSKEPRKSLLKLLFTVNISVQKIFKAADFFKEKGQPDNIRFWFSNDFRDRFLIDADKIELDSPAAILNIYELSEASADSSILTALGDKDMAKTRLAYIAQFIKGQPNGEESLLLNEGGANIFYVEDVYSVLWTIHCSWDSDFSRWNVGMRTVTSLRTWSTDHQIFSPSVLTY